MTPTRVPLATRVRRLLLAAAALATILVVWVAPAPSASAHAELVSTTPVNQGVVDPANPDVRFIFNEQVTVQPDAFQLYDANGTRTPLDTKVVDTDVQVTLPSGLPTGSYIIGWRVVSADEHPVGGSLPFGYGETFRPLVGVKLESATPLGVTVAYLVAQALAYLGLLVLAGLAVFAVFVAPAGARPRVAVPAAAGPPGPSGQAAVDVATGTPPSDDPPSGASWRAPELPRSSRRLGWVAALLSTVATFVLIPLGVVRDENGTIADLTLPTTWANGVWSAYGLAFALVVLGSLAVLVVAPMVSGLGRTAALLGGGALLVLSPLAVGHTRSVAPAWLVVGSAFVHLACAALWLGGVVALWMALRTARLEERADPGGGPRSPAAAATVARFSMVAGGLVAALVVTGTALALTVLGGLSDGLPRLVSTTYGQALLTKVGLVAVLVALAAWNKYQLVPAVERAAAGAGSADPADSADSADSAVGAAAGWRRLRTAIRDEVLVLVLVLCVTSVLSATSPGGGSTANAVDPSAPLTGTLGTTSVQVQINPGTVGTNTIDITLRDASGKPVTPLEPPTVRMRLTDPPIGPLTSPSSTVAAGRYRASIDVPASGTWQLEISARLSTFDEPSTAWDVVIE